MPFVTTFNPATPNLKKILMKHWYLITEKNKLAQAFPKPPIVAYRKDKCLKYILVRAKIPSHILQQHLGVIYGKGRVTTLQKLRTFPRANIFYSIDFF